jgi:DNA-directed RNA polymerase specialized sigma24 family protein
VIGRHVPGLPLVPRRTNEAAWLLRILHNTWISEHRKKKRRPSDVAAASRTTTVTAGPSHACQSQQITGRNPP